MQYQYCKKFNNPTGQPDKLGTGEGTAPGELGVLAGSAFCVKFLNITKYTFWGLKSKKYIFVGFKSPGNVFLD